MLAVVSETGYPSPTLRLGENKATAPVSPITQKWIDGRRRTIQDTKAKNYGHVGWPFHAKHQNDTYPQAEPH